MFYRIIEIKVDQKNDKVKKNVKTFREGSEKQ